MVSIPHIGSKSRGYLLGCPTPKIWESALTLCEMSWVDGIESLPPREFHRELWFSGQRKYEGYFKLIVNQTLYIRLFNQILLGGKDAGIRDKVTEERIFKSSWCGFSVISNIGRGDCKGRECHQLIKSVLYFPLIVLIQVCKKLPCAFKIGLQQCNLGYTKMGFIQNPSRYKTGEQTRPAGEKKKVNAT